MRSAAMKLSFIDEILEAFTRIEAVSAKRWAVAASWGDMSALVGPALLLRDFAFTGDTAF